MEAERARTRKGKGGGKAPQGKRIWRPSAEVAEKFCGTWLYKSGSASFEILLTDRGTLQFVDSKGSSAILEPGEKKSLQGDFTNGVAGTIRVRHNESSGLLQTQFRGVEDTDWRNPKVAHNASAPPEPPASELQALLDELSRQWPTAKGEGSVSGLEAALESLKPVERLWLGKKSLSASAARNVLEELRQLQLWLLLELAERCLAGEPPVAPARALECCDTAEEAIRAELEQAERARALTMRGLALAALGRNTEAVLALAPACLLAPSSEEESDALRTLLRLRPEVAEEELLSRVSELRQEGNAWLRAGRIEWGAQRYEEALTLLWGRPWPTEQQIQEAQRQPQSNSGDSSALLQQAEVALLTNLALCYLQGSGDAVDGAWPADPAHAVRLCKMTLDVDPKNTKAMVRKARGHSDLYQFEEAAMQLSYAAELEPNDATILRELAVAKRHADDARRKARKWEKDAYHGLFDRVSTGLFPDTGEKVAESTGQAATWPVDIFPTPLLRMGADEIDGFAAELAHSLEADGEGAYTMELLHAVRYAVELEYGQGAARRLARMVPFVHVMTSCGDAVSGTKCTFEIGKGQRRLTSRLEGLLPEQPFHALDEHAWSSALVLQVEELAAELKQVLQNTPDLWEVPWSKGSTAPAWRSISLVKQGSWVAAGRFPRTLEILSKLEGLRPYDACFLRLPPQVMLQHSANANAVLTGHLLLGEGTGTLCVGEHLRDWQSRELQIFDPTYVHAARNEASTGDALFFVCHFYHPGVSDEERYTLLFLEALIQRLQKTGLFAAASLAPSAGIDVQKALKYAA